MTRRLPGTGPGELLTAGVSLSKVGAYSYTVVMTWAVSSAAGNGSVGWVNATAGLTTLLIGFLAAMWLDNFDRRTLLLLFDAAAALIALTSAALLLAAGLSIYLAKK